MAYSNIGKYFRPITTEDLWYGLAKIIRQENCSHEIFPTVIGDFCSKCIKKL